MHHELVDAEKVSPSDRIRKSDIKKAAFAAFLFSQYNGLGPSTQNFVQGFYSH